MVITVGATMAVGVACGGRASSPSGPPACSGTGTCNPQPVECPTTTPNPGEACAGEGTCPYTAYGCPNDMSCTNGQWTAVGGSCNPPAMPPDAAVACPAEPPAAGTPCSGTANEVCSYQSADGCPNDVSCTDGQWTFLGGGCNPPPLPEDAAVVDAAVACPEEAPAAGTPCNAADEICSYQNPDGCPDDLSCSGGEWTPIAGGCNPPPLEVDAAVVDASGE